MVRNLLSSWENNSRKKQKVSMFCIVSWHNEGRDLGFWGGDVWGWGVSEHTQFFDTRKKAAAALRKVRESMGPGFLKANILDVDAFNKKFGKSVGPRPKIETTTAKLDPKTGIVERVEMHG